MVVRERLEVKPGSYRRLVSVAAIKLELKILQFV